MDTMPQEPSNSQSVFGAVAALRTQGRGFVVSCRVQSFWAVILGTPCIARTSVLRYRRVFTQFSLRVDVSMITNLFHVRLNCAQNCPSTLIGVS